LDNYHTISEDISGKCFGDIELVNNKTRKNTCYATENCQLFYIDKEDFKQCFGKLIRRTDLDRRDLFLNMLPSFTRSFDKNYPTVENKVNILKISLN